MAKTAGDGSSSRSTQLHEVGGNNPEINAAKVDQTVEAILEERIDKTEEKILKIEATVFQVANYYFVFQGVILTAIVRPGSSTPLTCLHSWLPFSLSLIGAVVNFVTLLVVVDKYKEYLEELDRRTLTLNKHLYKQGFKAEQEKHKNRKKWRKLTLVSSLILFAIFALLNLAGTLIIPCLT